MLAKKKMKLEVSGQKYQLEMTKSPVLFPYSITEIFSQKNRNSINRNYITATASGINVVNKVRSIIRIF